MKKIYTRNDICQLQEAGHIFPELAKHFLQKFEKLHRVLDPDCDINSFSLESHGPFGLLEVGDRDLTGMGLPESLAEIMPEWISRLSLAGELCYILYVMANNDYVLQIYLPDTILEDIVRAWLNEQPAEEEEGGDDSEPVPF